MMFRTHVTFSIFISALIFLSFEISNKPIFLAAAVIASAIPDIDTPRSKPGKQIWPLSFFLKLIFGHRGIFHSLLFAAAASVLIAIISIELSAAFAVGFLSHILLDSLTESGTKPFYPFSEKKIRSFLRTGSLTENLFFIALIVLIIFFII